MTVRWPKALTPQGVQPTPAVPVAYGGQPLSGSAQRAASSAGHWRFDYQAIPLWGARLEQARSVAAQIRMGVDPILVSPCDWWNAPVGMSASVTQLSAALGATTLVVRSTGALWREGIYFGLGGERSHLIAAVAAYGGDPRDQTLTFWPPLRAAVLSGVSLDVADPLVLCSVAPGSNLLSAISNLGRGSSLNISFQEQF